MFEVPPESNYAEITLIGTGGGYGESIIIHLGDNEWCVVDSCIDPNSKKCLPLEYLQAIGVDVANQVKLIVCTHWHDDHLLGLTKLFEVARKSAFCLTEVTDKTKFLQFVELDYLKLSKEASNSSTYEFGSCIKIAQARKSLIKLAKENTVLFAARNSTSRSEVISLSPSDYTILNFQKELSTLITDFGPSNKKIVTASPNSKSVVLYLKLGNHRAILGADLELSLDDREGWINILDNNNVIDRKSSLFKVPHHGSENGYTERVWLELLEANSIAKLTPWNRNKKLPEIKMLQKLCNHTENVYMTTGVFSEKGKKRDNTTEKIIKNLKLKLAEVKFKPGIIRCRIPMDIEGASWDVQVFDNAFHVNPTIKV